MTSVVNHGRAMVMPTVVRAVTSVPSSFSRRHPHPRRQPPIRIRGCDASGSIVASSSSATRFRARALRLGEDGAAKARPRIRFAGAVANIPPGGTTNLRLTLTRRGRQIARTPPRNRLRGVMEIRNSIGPVQTVRVTIRLRR